MIYKTYNSPLKGPLVPDHRRYWRWSYPIKLLWGSRLTSETLHDDPAILLARTNTIRSPNTRCFSCLDHIETFQSLYPQSLISIAYRRLDALISPILAGIPRYTPDIEPIIEYEKASIEGFNTHHTLPGLGTLYVPEEGSGIRFGHLGINLEFRTLYTYFLDRISSKRLALLSIPWDLGRLYSLPLQHTFCVLSFISLYQWV